MKLGKLRRKRIIIPTVAALAVVGAGATVWTATASADDNVSGSERDRVAAAAVEAVGGGSAVEVETSDDPGVAYEVEVRAEEGSETDVELDENLEVVSQQADDDRADDADDTTDDADDDKGDKADTPDADDRALSAQERAAAEKAALEAVSGGTVLSVEASDDRGEAYEVEVRDTDGTEWEITLDADHQVLKKDADN